MTDHPSPTPEGRRCPECGRAPDREVIRGAEVTRWCNAHGQFPTPAPVGGVPPFTPEVVAKLERAMARVPDTDRAAELLREARAALAAAKPPASPADDPTGLYYPLLFLCEAVAPVLTWLEEDDAETATPTSAEGGEARIYTASRAVHGPLWLERRAGGAPIVASWINEWDEGQTSDWPAHWDRCLTEAASATALVLYAQEGESLVGALAETGAALRVGVPVFYVGPDAAIRKLARHRLVTRCASLDEAFRLASLPSPTLAATGGEEHEGDKRALASLSKAWPYLADHASHIDGEFNNAHEYVRRTLALLRRQLAEAEATMQARAVARLALEAEYEAEVAALTERATTAERRLEEMEREERRVHADLSAALRGMNDAQQEVARLREALAFAASCIKSGESWTPTCAEIIGGALSSPHQSTGQGA